MCCGSVPEHESAPKQRQRTAMGVQLDAWCPVFETCREDLASARYKRKYVVIAAQVRELGSGRGNGLEAKLSDFKARAASEVRVVGWVGLKAGGFRQNGNSRPPPALSALQI